MAIERSHQMFPTLSPMQRQIAMRFAGGQPKRYEPNEIVFGLGDQGAPAFVVTSGSIDVFRRTGLGNEELITSHPEGGISGEIAQLAGRPTLAEGRAGPQGCEAVSLDAVHLRALIIGSAEIGETLMRAFILRRTALIREGGAGLIILGLGTDPRVVRLEEFLSRNGYPYSVLCPGADPNAQLLVDRLAIAMEEMPVVVCPNGTVLRRPSEADVGRCLGITPTLDPEMVHDVIVVGAGPAGLATAVYAASEGLSVLVLDARAFGGQAGASARIENYFGFPTGISGIALTARAFTQAQKFGAEIAVPLQVERLECIDRKDHQRQLPRLILTDGQVVQARSVVIASGVRYRQLDISNLASFEGFGVSYWASAIEARLCEGEDVALVGGGNSAGQAVVFLAPKVKHLHLIIRGESLEASMSKYLIERISALPNVTLHRRTEVIALDGEHEVSLSHATFRNRDTGATFIMPLRHLFLFIGADANTGWLKDCPLELDDKGYVKTGEQARMADRTGSARAPKALETSMHFVFAIGDVRSGSTKRVAAAVGEGAAVVAQIHEALSLGRRSD
ncbi:FAD-dependent oxidoreductase [Dokdonella sp.]|uniref:FAD-dependent oxidoreductase n=1 Tax=Dokdonella sp. TaxID=2291710 RepID=UPI003C4DC6BC